MSDKQNKDLLIQLKALESCLDSIEESNNTARQQLNEIRLKLQESRKDSVKNNKIYDMDSEVNQLLNETHDEFKKFKFTYLIRQDWLGLLLILAFLVFVVWLGKKYYWLLLVSPVIVIMLHLIISHFSNKKLYDINQKIYRILKQHSNCDYLTKVLASRVQKKKDLNKQFYTALTLAAGLCGITGISLGINFNDINLNSIVWIVVACIVVLIIVSLFVDVIIFDTPNLTKWEILAENAKRVKIENDRVSNS